LFEQEEEKKETRISFSYFFFSSFS